MILILTYTLEGMFCGLAAFLFANVLTSPGHILQWWPNLVRKVFTGSKEIRPEREYNFIQLFFIKVLGGCAVCMAFWIAIAHSFYLDNPLGAYWYVPLSSLFFAFALGKIYQ